jgi:protein-disulfide isomerase
VTILEYGDYESVACAQAHSSINALRRRFGNQLRVVFRHFPFGTLRMDAQHAAQASEAANSQGCFWEMHDLLFDNQVRLSDKHLRGYAAHLGIDMVRFNREMAAQAHVVRVREDFLSGIRSGVTHSPAFFVNGTRHLGSLEIGSFLRAIDKVA